MKTEILTTFGLSETAVADALADFGDRFPKIHLEVQAAFPEVHVRLSPRPSSGSAENATVEDAVAWSRQQLGRYCLSAEGKPLEEVVGDLLREQKASVAVAESCTGGLISHLLTNVSGSSDYFLMAGVTYANQAKQQLLGVSEKTLLDCGAVHENTAAEMAIGIRRVSGASYGLATTGIAGPTGGSREKPVGTLCVGLAGPDGVETGTYLISSEDRLSNKKIFAATALDLLRTRLLDRITHPVRGGDPCCGKPDRSAI